ncbi:quorum-sensing sensor histidine kinase AgrC [Staphylococcus agnetis]|uniref:quorum-sensing sensor histidine kinase AgrC n=1 Tax=Staphylococcus agnetis TaxID=985762 RepID=UPI0004E2CBF2|nr:accessory gene regulator protein C [Staphylococcus agnetis]NJH65325.1 GHKL domain-containing protein [Staphylococcus agnetis]PTH48183.1 GHKL domain-containing protein [Staphylococcus agnetis]PTH72305.1 GHKL domain-containing protein [Staphylococcus agnetis]PTH75613.1 GHKL domain-containing protein [Staphylococcus agnetis]
MDILNIIIISVFQVYVFFQVINIIIIDKIKYKYWDYIALFLGVVVPCTILFLFLGRNSLIALVIGFLIFFYLKKKILGLISVLSSVVILVICDFLATWFYYYINNLSIHPKITFIIYMFVFTFLAIIIALVVRLLMIKLKYTWLYGNKIYLVSLVICLLTFFIVLFIFLPTQIQTMGDYKILGMFYFTFVAIFIAILLLVTITTSREINYRRSQQEIEDYYNYTLRVEQVNNRMRKFRHDYINILSTMSEYLREDDLEGLKAYYNKHISPLKDHFEANTLKLNGVENLKVKEIKGVITTKILQAQERQIEISVEVADEINEINMEMIDLSRILGIIMDNAIEASMNLESPMIQIAFIKTEQSVLIIIMNKAPDNLPKLHTLYQEGFSTKGKNRGLGLPTLKEITDSKDNVFLETTIENHYFIQKLEIMNNDA